MSKKRSRTAGKRDPKTVAFWAFMAVSLVAIVGGFVFTQNRGVADTSYVSNYTPTTPAPIPHNRVVILGDSYTAGAGGAQDNGYANQLSNLFCWDSTLLSQGGTGYTNPGQAAEGEGVFLGRVQQAIDANPEIVIVQGSTNDKGGPATQEAAREVFATLKAGLPNAAIIAVGPTAPPKANPVELESARNAVAAAAQSEGIAFIDPIQLGWLTNAADFSDDGIHPNSSGHKLFAELLFDRIKGLHAPQIKTC